MGLNKECIELIDSVDLQVLELKLEVVDLIPILGLYVKVNSASKLLKFKNVSCINIRDFSPPFQIQGLEILNNKSRGWEKELSYSVSDYEDGKISFHCENVEILDWA